MIRKRKPRPVPGKAEPGVGRGGLSDAFVTQAMVEQGGLCALCRSRPGSHADHDHVLAALHPHAPGRYCPRCFRGMLCLQCNTALGLLGDDPARMRAAADYVETRRRRLAGRQ